MNWHAFIAVIGFVVGLIVFAAVIYAMFAGMNWLERRVGYRWAGVVSLVLSTLAIATLAGLTT